MKSSSRPSISHACTIHGVAHVLNAWTRMPELQDQIVMPEIFTSDFTVFGAASARAGPYEQAVAQFSPYKETQDINPGAAAPCEP